VEEFMAFYKLKGKFGENIDALFYTFLEILGLEKILCKKELNS